MKKFFLMLLSDSNGVSSRRFISIILLPFYIAAIVVGLCLSWIYDSFNYFLASLLAAGIPIMIAFFLLTWEHVKDIVKEFTFSKKTNNTGGEDTTFTGSE